MAGSDMKNIHLEDDLEEERLEPPPYSATEERDKHGFDRSYFFSAPGALKMIEIVLDLIGFIASIANWAWGPYGGGFVQYVTMSAFITTFILFLIRALRMHHRIHCYFELVEFIYLIIYVLKMFIAAIVAGSRATADPTIMAACAVCAVAFFIYLLDCIMAYRRYTDEKAERERAVAEGQAPRRSQTSFCVIF